MVSETDFQSHAGVIDLELKDIRKNFDKLEVLRGLSLVVSKGEICCLLGPSGCGKTTLLKIINGLLEPDSGTVLLADKDITNLPCQQRDLGMVFQNYALFPHMNVFDNLAYGLRRRHIPGNRIKEKVTESLKLVRLSGYESRRVHELSGGQQQRIALARALVIEPQALLLDEPLSNLDAKLRAEMRQEIRHIQRQLGITTIYVTHDQEEAMSIADRIVVMNNGNIEQIGTPEEIYENPATEFVSAFLGNINFIPGEITGSELILLGRKFPVPDGSNLPSGRITCALRPERISLNTGNDRVIECTVKESTYLGSIVRYHISVDDSGTERELIAQVPVSSRIISFGDRVGIRFEYDDIRFFPDAGNQK